MKRFFVLYFLLNAAIIFCKSDANKYPLLTKDSLPFVFSESWRFNPSDTLEMAEPNYDDSKWIMLNSRLAFLNNGNKAFKGIGWFRYHYSIDSALQGKTFGFKLNHLGASQIYIDGILVKSYGEIKDSTSTIYYNPNDIPFILNFNKAGEHVIAIRYANYDAFTNYNIYNEINAGFTLSLNEADKLISSDSLSRSFFLFVLTFLFGLFAALSLLHLIFYFYSPSIRSNLYFSIFIFSISLGFLKAILLINIHNVSLELLLGYISVPILVLAVWGLVSFIHNIFSLKSGWLYWMIMGIAILLVVGRILNFKYITQVVFLHILFVFLYTIIQILRAIYKKTKGAKIIGSGILFFAFFIVLVIIQSIVTDNFDLNDSNTVGQMLLIIMLLAIVSIPISMSVYLAWNFSIVNKDLKLQLDQVNMLSQKTLEQEQEKKKLLENRKKELEKEVTQRTAELESTLQDLKLTQTQLIQQEKLASLGQLTAGVAHEIKNPLNFINNFSKISLELITEIEQVKSNEEKEELYNDLKSNLEKISKHGQRADVIVKGMLQHSRKNETVKNTFNINQLCSETLELVYTNFRITHPHFKCEITKILDEKLSDILAIQSDINRCLVNIITNALFAVKDRPEPKLNITTQFLESYNGEGKSALQIIITDNGIGIPEGIKLKIFEPFFTTKAANEGTGLGLSLSNDIIKAHRGTIAVNSKENVGTEFSILLPI